MHTLLYNFKVISFISTIVTPYELVYCVNVTHILNPSSVTYNLWTIRSHWFFQYLTHQFSSESVKKNRTNSTSIRFRVSIGPNNMSRSTPMQIWLWAAKSAIWLPHTVFSRFIFISQTLVQSTWLASYYLSLCARAILIHTFLNKLDTLAVIFSLLIGCFTLKKKLYHHSTYSCRPRYWCALYRQVLPVFPFTISKILALFAVGHCIQLILSINDYWSLKHIPVYIKQIINRRSLTRVTIYKALL